MGFQSFLEDEPLVDGESVHEKKGGALALLAGESMGNEARNVVNHQRTAGRVIEQVAIMADEPRVKLLVHETAELGELLLILGAGRRTELGPEMVGLCIAVGEHEPGLGRGVFVRTALEKMLPKLLEAEVGVLTLVPEKANANPRLVDGLTPIPIHGRQESIFKQVVDVNPDIVVAKWQDGWTGIFQRRPRLLNH